MDKKNIAFALTKEIWDRTGTLLVNYHASKKKDDLPAYVSDITDSLVEIYNAVYAGLVIPSIDQD